MQFLRLMGVSSDGSSLILVGGEGRQFRVAVDDALRTAVRASRVSATPQGAPLGLPPREIQARLRAGEAAEDVARAAGVAVEKVRNYEVPILAERAHMARMAQQAIVRRPAGTPAGARTLGELVSRRVEGEGYEAETVGWDSWRREDGRWVVRVTLPADTDTGGESPRLGRSHGSSTPAPAELTSTGHWIFDTGSRSVAPLDDVAAELLVERAPRPEPTAAVVHSLAAAREEQAQAPSRMEQLSWPPTQQHPGGGLDIPERAAVGESRRSRRAAVPAWDDILLGARRGD